MEKIIANCDGGSRGNPGPSALGVSILMNGEHKDYSRYLGEGTNNEAEYQAVIFALKKIKALVGSDKAKKTKIEIRLDSELVESQLNAKYKLKESRLFPFFIEIWNLRQEFGEIRFVYVPREENRRPDTMVNKELDSQTKLV